MIPRVSNFVIKYARLWNQHRKVPGVQCSSPKQILVYISAWCTVLVTQTNIGLYYYLVYSVRHPNKYWLILVPGVQYSSPKQILVYISAWCTVLVTQTNIGLY
jgi:hypothetical protein